MVFCFKKNNYPAGCVLDFLNDRPRHIEQFGTFNEFVGIFCIVFPQLCDKEGRNCIAPCFFVIIRYSCQFLADSIAYLLYLYRDCFYGDREISKESSINGRENEICYRLVSLCEIYCIIPEEMFYIGILWA